MPKTPGGKRISEFVLAIAGRGERRFLPRLGAAAPVQFLRWTPSGALGQRWARVAAAGRGGGRPASISQRLRGRHRLRNPQERPGCTGIRPGLKPSQRMCWESPHRDVPGKAKSTRQNGECEGRRRSPRAIPEGFGRISP